MPNVNDTRYVASGPGYAADVASGRVSSSSNSNSGSSTPSAAISFNPPGSGVSASYYPKSDLSYSDLADLAGSFGTINNFDLDFDSIGQYIRDAIDTYSSSAQKIANHNTQMSAQLAREATAASQQMAREQMAYQTQSDSRAMAFSAQQAALNRDWQESLSNSAHQREVQDLIAAGLNPILSANAGAYTGSGATAQGFSSSGAMGQSFLGQVDTSASQLLGQLVSSSISTASQAAITGMYTDASKYQADMQYAAAKLASEASIYNNQNSVSAQKAIAALNNQTDIQKANINASATLGAAGTSAAAMRYGSELSSAAQRFAAQMNYDASVYSSDHNISKDPVGYVLNSVPRAINGAGDLLDKLFTPSSNKGTLPLYPTNEGYEPWRGNQ